MTAIDRFVSAKIDTEDAFGVANADDVSAVTMAVIRGSVQIQAEREALEEDSVTPDHGQWDPVEGSAASSTFGFSTRAGGLGTTTTPDDTVDGATDGETPDRTSLGQLMLSLFGTEVIIDGDTVAAAPTPTVAAFSLTTQSSLTTPLAILLVACDSGGIQAIPVSIASGVCTCLMQPSAAPTASGVVYGALIYTLTEGLDTADSFQGIFVSDSVGHKYRILGGMVSQAVLNLSARKLPKMDIQALMNSWSVVTDALAASTPPPSRPWMDAVFRMSAVGTLTYDAGQLYKVKGDLQFTMGRSLQPEDDPNHAEGASGYEDPSPDPFLKFSPILPWSVTWRDAFGLNAGNSWHMLAVSSRQPGRGVGIYSQKVIQSAYPSKVEHNGMIRVQPEFAQGAGYSQPGVVFAIF
jgi:hypothetical protein